MTRDAWGRPGGLSLLPVATFGGCFAAYYAYVASYHVLVAVFHVAPAIVGG